MKENALQITSIVSDEMRLQDIVHSGICYNMFVLFNHDKPIEEKEFPDESDIVELEDAQESLSAELFRCPYCGRFVYDQADKCPYCGEWIVNTRSSWRSSRKWYVRAGLYLTKVLVLNWIAWLIIAGLIALIAAIKAFR